MRIVEFENGKYGIEKIYFFFFKRYVDLKSPRNTWTNRDYFFKDCQGTFEDCKKALYPMKVKRYL